MRQHIRRVLVLLLVLGSVIAWLYPPGVQTRPLTSFDLAVAGLDLAVGPATQQLPKGVSRTVTTQLTVPQASIPLALLQKLLPQSLTVKGELSGPVFATPITLSVPVACPLPSAGRIFRKDLMRASQKENFPGTHFPFRMSTESR